MTLAMRSLTKSLGGPVQGDPVFMRRVNGWLTMFWLAMIPISYAMRRLNSVVYVLALSLWLLFPVTGRPGRQPA